MRRRAGAAVVFSAVLTFGLVSSAHAGSPPREPVAAGFGGAVASVDPDATAIGLDVLRRGGNAVDAAIATAAALGVTEPYSAGVGGGGFLVSYDARTGTVHTLDGRETAPAAMTQDAFLGDDGKPLLFADLVNSTLSVGVPGTPATWERALADQGTMSLADVLSGPRSLAERGFVVDQEFHDQTVENAQRFRDFTSTAQLFLADGNAPGSATCSPTPTWPAPTSCSPTRVPGRSTAANSAAPSSTPSPRRPSPTASRARSCAAG